MPLVILHHLLNVSVQLANKRGFKKNFKKAANYKVATVKIYVDFFTSITYSNFK
jgi:hypothetical protein